MGGFLLLLFSVASGHGQRRSVADLDIIFIMTAVYHRPQLDSEIESPPSLIRARLEGITAITNLRRRAVASVFVFSGAMAAPYGDLGNLRISFLTTKLSRDGVE